MVIESETVLTAIKCRRAYLLDGCHWSGSHQTDWGGVYDDPQADVIGWSASEILGRPLDRTERRQVTAALRKLAADGQIRPYQTGKRTVAVELLEDPAISDRQRAAFDRWRIAFSGGALAASETKREAERQLAATEAELKEAARLEAWREQSEAYRQSRKRN